MTPKFIHLGCVLSMLLEKLLLTLILSGKNEIIRGVYKMNSIGTKYLETERLSLRRISLDDANNVYREILGNKGRLHFLDWNYAADINEAKIYIENIINSYSKETYFFWLIEEKVKQKFVGCIFVCNSDISKRIAEIEYVASDKTQGHGYMTEALYKIIDFLIKEVGYYRIEGVCNIENKASARVMEKAGMVLEGTLRGRALNMNEDGNPGDLKMYSFIPIDRE
jgi:ribosomal-protein-alanine N-acetyltransferase